MRLSEASFLEIADEQALVLTMRVRVRIFNPDEQRGRPAERFRERLDERDAPPGGDHERLLAVAGSQRLARDIERRTYGLGRPGRPRRLGLEAHLEAPGQVLFEMTLEKLKRLAWVHARDQADG